MVCCDTCPGSFHVDCIAGKQGFIQPPDGESTWSCPECINGTKPCVDDIVWAKVGNYRWWPAKIRNMEELPEQLAKKTPPPGSFAVCYYGTNEWGFQSHACTVSWEKGDERRRFSLGTKKKNFSEAVDEAKDAYDERLSQREAVATHSNFNLATLFCRGFLGHYRILTALACDLLPTGAR
jgi:histone-lysine N-methyltransferase NSD2